ncbi:MAG TPA: lipase [Cytophagales bacterium]|nr:lipase [Cytophagales bacterium]
MKILTPLFLIPIFLLGCQPQESKDSPAAETPQITVTTHTFATHADTALALDFYLPNDTAGQWPLVVYVHGGGFYEGVRDSEEVVEFAMSLAEAGFAVASVDYRLTMQAVGLGCDVPAADKQAAFDAGATDVGRALAFILGSPQLFPIDAEQVVLAGSSAGAETVLNLAFAHGSPDLPANFQPAGLISMAGALYTLDSLDASRLIPTLLFHGTADPWVPFGAASHHFCEPEEPGHWMLYGSAAIARRLEALGGSYFLYSVIAGNHDWATLPMKRNLDDILDFLHRDAVNPKEIRQTERTVNPQGLSIVK